MASAIEDSALDADQHFTSSYSASNTVSSSAIPWSALYGCQLLQYSCEIIKCDLPTMAAWFSARVRKQSDGNKNNPFIFVPRIQTSGLLINV